MTDPTIAWVIAAGAAAAAFVFWMNSQGAHKARQKAESERDSARGELEAARKKAEEKGELARRRADDVEELKRKLAKTKKRAKGAQQTASTEARQIKGLEEELALVKDELRIAHERLNTLQDELTSARAKAGKGGGSRGRREDPDTIDRWPQKKAPPKAVDAVPDTSELGKLRDEVKKHAEDLRELKKTVATKSREAETHRRVYMIQKGELDAARDRVRTLELQLRKAGLDPLSIARTRLASTGATGEVIDKTDLPEDDEDETFDAAAEAAAEAEALAEAHDESEPETSPEA